MVKLEKVEAAPFFGDVALRVHFDGEGAANGMISPEAAMELSRSLAKAAKAAGYVKPAKGAAGA
jgi:hypothetical protein